MRLNPELYICNDDGIDCTALVAEKAGLTQLGGDGPHPADIPWPDPDPGPTPRPFTYAVQCPGPAGANSPHRKYFDGEVVS